MQNTDTTLQFDENSTVSLNTPSPSFFSGVLSLAGGATVAQAIGLISSPIICRIFSPDDFGLAGIFRSIVMILSILTCLRYELAIMLPKKNEDTATLFIFCCFLTLVSTSLIGIVFIYLGNFILQLLKAEELVPYLWLAPVCIFIIGLALPFRTWCNRHQQYKQLSYSRIFSSVSRNFALITSGLLGYRTVITLILCLVLESAIAILVLFKQVILHDLPFILKHFKIKLVLPLARRYIKFPMISSISTLLNTSVYQIPVFLFAYYLGVTVVGYYSRCLLLLGMPITLISGAISTVFYQRVTQWKNEGRSVNILVEGVILRLLYLTIMPFLLITFFGKDIYTILLGNQWSEAGIYAGILAPRYLFLAITTSLMTTFVAYERQGHELFFNILLTIFTVIAIALGGSIFNNARITILLFSLAGIIVYILRLAYILSIVKASIGRIIRQFIPFSVSIIPLLTIAAGARWWLHLSSLWLLLIIVIVTIIYYFFALHKDEYLKNILHSFIRDKFINK